MRLLTGFLLVLVICAGCSSDDSKMPTTPVKENQSQPIPSNPRPQPTPPPVEQSPPSLDESVDLSLLSGTIPELTSIRHLS
jgi:hypothetical protein